MKINLAIDRLKEEHSGDEELWKRLMSFRILKLLKILKIYIHKYLSYGYF